MEAHFSMREVNHAVYIISSDADRRAHPLISAGGMADVVRTGVSLTGHFRKSDVGAQWYTTLWCNADVVYV